MRTTPFDSVYRVAELAMLLMDPLAISAIIALSLTSKSNMIRVQGYMR